MTDMLDLGPAAVEMARLIEGVTDDQLTAPTPCERYTLGGLLGHISGLSLAFAGAASKDLGPMTSRPPSPEQTRLDDDWREALPGQLTALAAAWRDPAAWQGTTQVGGMELPGALAGRIGLNELVIHGWDVARASGQPYHCQEQSLRDVMGFLTMAASPEERQGRDGLFGPVVEVPEDAPLLDRAIGLSGRDPSWRAAA